MDILLRPKEEIVVNGTLPESSAPLGQEEASSSRLARDAPPVNLEKGKVPFKRAMSTVPTSNLRI